MEINVDEIALKIDLDQGSRISSLVWRGLEFVVQPRPSLMDWGWYAMVPWAGRIKNGLIKGESGNVYHLPTSWEPPHAEHGYGFYSPWESTGNATSRLHLPRPYNQAVAEQTFEIEGNTFHWTLDYTSNGCEIPAWIGFHPWFPRDLGIGGNAIVEFQAESMLIKGPDGMPSGEFATPKPPPWDDAFIGIKNPPSILWPGAARVRISSTSPWWVIYTEDKDGICLEPQSAPPDAANLGISGEHHLEATFTFSEGRG